MKADLHVHSYFSDGSSSPEELLKLALNHHMNILSVVDQDTSAGLAHIRQVFAPSPINFIEGIEVTAYDFKRRQQVHILGYNLLNYQYIEQLCEPLRAARTRNTLRQLRRIQTEGFRIKEEQVRQFAKQATALYKQHIMSALIKAGYDTSIDGHLYRKLFKYNDFGQEEAEMIDVYEVIQAIKLGGGMSVVAHPGKLDSFELIPELASFGIDGIEKYHPEHSLKDQRKVQELIDRFNIHCFGGSDFKGKNGPDYFGECAMANVREFPDELLLDAHMKAN
ncbi:MULTISPECIES: PHP domain-containing protein [Enterococcus]|uniref:PHP domain-containing protein n=1 Tax=Enterococcus mundtii TaxID=53346 RepID=A0A848MUC5_ENTMU|nr:PHP domain-containing protein [Enterococcus mundtii]MBE9909888.1 PHP domain-containing protein [Enterococcus mundtii]MRI73689.1 PHP domain-containing protein [Enterococcus mundtii]NMP57852.1 PHP domain-containing protein [Enterococcus mundtii]